MKRLIALLLAFVIPFTTIGSVVAETLHLPVDLKDIEEETFGYTLSLGEVDVAFGTETIGSKAFVNSGLSKIYIPATVSYIAPDAFDGTNVSIVTPDGTYAKEFADEHGFTWEDGSDHYKKDTMEAVKDYLESEEEADSIVMEDTEVTLLSTEGITDVAQLAEIEEINRLLLVYQESAVQYTVDLDALTEAFGELADEVSNVSIEKSSDSVGISIGDATYTLSGDALESLSDDYEVISIENAEDGNSVVTEVVSGGETYYLISSANGTVVSTTKEPSVQNYTLARSGVGSNIIVTINGYISRIQTIVTTVEHMVSAAVSAAETAAENALAALAALMKYNLEYEVPEDVLAAATKRLRTAEKILEGVNKAANALKSISVPGTISTIYADTQKWQVLEKINEHGHPLAHIAADAERFSLIDMMNENISSAQYLYVCDIILNAGDLILSLAGAIAFAAKYIPPLAGPAAAVEFLSKSILVIMAMHGAQLISSSTAESKYNAAIVTDFKLHSFVHGYVRDSETGETIPSTAVTNGSVAVNADQKGFYKIYLLPDSHTLIFRAEGYEKNAVVITLNEKQELIQDVELTPEPDGATVFGTVKSKETGELLADVQVLCGDLETWTDETGYFSFEKLEPGDHTISFYKVGYARWEITLPLEEDQKLELNAALDDCYIITNREELEAVANDVMGNYTLGNSIELGDEPWTPLPWFSGTLDGAGYSINGMQLTEGVAGENNAGLFVGLYNGHVSNLTMNGVNVELTAQGSMLGIGAICGGLNNGSSLTNCKVNGTVNVTADTSNNSVYVGGLAGIGDTGYITDCYSGANVSIVTPNIGHAGGLAGMLGGGQARNSDAAGSVTVVQSGSNSGASLNAFGTMYTSGIISDDCNAGGNVSAHSTNGFASAYGTVNANNSLNTASVSASTESGNATARGAYGGENSSNNSGILATATGSGHSVAIGLHGVNGGKNIGSITARAAFGSAMARGGESVGSNVTNSGNVTAESVSGGSNAGGIYGQGSSSKNCSNSGSVAATGDTNQALAIGMNSCAESQNTGRVSATSTKGDAVGQGMTSCASSTNYGDVDVTYVGEDDAEGGLSAQGLNSCTNSTNVGSVTGTVKASTTACTVSGTSGGSGNVNQGAVTAASSSGPANARGVRSSNSQNYGTVYARTSAENTGNDLCNATAYGTDASGSFNGGDVTAISENGGAHAYGHHGGGSSSGSVSAVSNFFMTGTDENGIDYGWVGVAHAYNSTSVQASVAGHSVSASGGNTVNLYYFYADSRCEDHMGMNRGFVSYEKGSEPDDFDGCFVHVGTASSDAN